VSVTGVPAGAFAERTTLAWQRTSLAILAAALIQLRLVAAEAPAVVLVVIGLAGALAVLAAVDSRRRDRGGRIGLLLTVSVATLVLVELGLVVG
jgi:uncharacterized membrane protein YidH (DUF202 family)